jgi:imidazolonepropionase-like amidohydrolase
MMLSGGAASPIDPIETVQYSEEEISAGVAEASAWNTYVMAHAYTPKAIARAVRCGVRSIEHASLVNAEVASLMAESGAVAVPTLATFDALGRFGSELGFSDSGMAKVRLIRDAGQAALATLKAAGTLIGFGTDLLGDLQRFQCREFELRRAVQSPLEMLRSATLDAAKILQMDGQLGEIREGAVADLVVAHQNPATSADVLGADGRGLRAVVKGGNLAVVDRALVAGTRNQRG